MKSLLKEANQAFKLGFYKKAEALYLEAGNKNPKLEKTLLFNASFARSKINPLKRITTNELKRIIPRLSFHIISTPHTELLAKTLRNRIIFYGWNCEIINSPPDQFNADYYIVLTPQQYKTLPPGEKRIVFQLEQSTSDRWFNQDYFNILENSLAVIDYSLANIKYLKTKGIAFPLVHYLPIGPFEDKNFSQDVVKDIDLLFYGANLSSERRIRMLESLKGDFKVEIINDKFGEEMHALIKRAKVVLNIHHYETSLLEMPRIMECISLGTTVLSETSSDQNYHSSFGNCVRFFKEGSSEEMREAIKQTLQTLPSKEEFRIVIDSFNKEFNFMFDRMMIGLKILPIEAVETIELLSPPEIKYICLSMPETIERQDDFRKYALDECFIFNGLRRSPGWIGCGMSYLALAHHAIKNKIKRLTVMEDDVELPKNFTELMKKINKYLDQKENEWDLFSGLIANLNKNAKVINVEEFEGITFVTIDKMTSTVCNIYHEKFLKTLAKWNPGIENAETNTIDRFIESHSTLKIITTVPFIVGHKEEVYSSLWGFQNTQYIDMIKESESQLKTKILEFKLSKMHQP